MALKNSFATSLMLNYDLTALIAVADPDPQIRGGWGRGGGRSPDNEIRGSPVSTNIFFIPSGLSLIYGGSPGPLPWIRH